MQIITSVLYYIRSILFIFFGFKNPVRIIIAFSGLAGKKPFEKSIQLKVSNISFFVRNPMDIWSIKETFLDDFYHFEKSAKPDTGVIIDIGAGIGEFAVQAAKACPEIHVYGFEPFSESMDFFIKNIEINSLTNITPISAAVSSVPGPMVLDTSSGNPLQFRMQTGVQGDSAIKTVLLMEFLSELTIDMVEVLKLDCEGGEFNILLPLSTSDLQKFRRIVMEYHDLLTNHTHIELVRHLESAGFSVDVNPNLFTKILVTSMRSILAKIIRKSGSDFHYF